MRRKNDAHKDELEGVAQRLRNERPEASPLQLDQIKTSAMSRAKAGTRRGAGARRLATAGLTIGLLAAGTGGVIAGTHGHDHGGNSGGNSNASNTQYGGECNISNGSGNVGNNNGNGANNNACNENTFITETTNNTTTNNTTNTNSGTTINNYTTVSATPTASSGVLAAKTTKKPTLSLRDIKIHLNLSHKSHLKRVTLKLNGKTFKVLKGSAASKNIKLTNLPCGNGATTVTVIAVTSTGKTVKESHTYHLCQA
ncbi:MAG TPA: hypothetical protein VGL54_03950 [Solirubrobacteraceae bacterium]|jgi:hypothetical protein